MVKFIVLMMFDHTSEYKRNGFLNHYYLMLFVKFFKLYYLDEIIKHKIMEHMHLTKQSYFWIFFYAQQYFKILKMMVYIKNIIVIISF